MEKGDFVSLVKITAHEIWTKEGRPEGGDQWFSDFLDKSEENYTLVVLVALKVLHTLWGDLEFEKKDLEELVDSIAEALLLWA